MKPKIIIVAGGLATRMKPITEEIPKCLIELDGEPLIQHQIEFFKKRGYKDFIFCIAHLADKVKEYFKDGSLFGVNIEYSQEPKELLGTAGAVKLVENMVGDICVVYYGDAITTVDFDEALEFHNSKKSDFTTVVRDLPQGYKSSSLITMDSSNRIDLFIEKPSIEEFEKNKDKKKYINSGIYIINKEIFNLIPENMKYDFAKQLIPEMLAKRCKVYGYVSNKFFREIGRVEKYEKFKEELIERKKVLE